MLAATIEKKECGRRLKEARQATGLNQEEAASRLGMKRGAYAQYEQGRYMPSVVKFLEIVHALDLDLAAIFPEFVKERQ